MSADEKRVRLLEEALEIERIGNRAVKKAQEENRRLGIPNVYAANGQIYYELPDGTLTTENPFKEDDPEKA